jgi:hypothetical protein
MPEQNNRNWLIALTLPVPPVVAHTCSSRRSALDGAGKAIEVTKYTEKLVPSTRFVAVDGAAPIVSPQSFVAPSASVVGNVTVGSGSR